MFITRMHYCELLIVSQIPVQSYHPSWAEGAITPDP